MLRIARQLAAIATAILAVAHLASAQDVRDTRPAVPTPGDHEIATYRAHVGFLANPFLEGRGPGTRGNVVAAEFIESLFKQLGLTPAFKNEALEAPERARPENRVQFQQQFSAGMRAVSSLCLMRADVPANERYGQPIGEPYAALGFSGDADIKAPLVFVGYGVQGGGPKKDYSTFADTDDLTGKIAVLLRFEPMDDQGHSRWKSATDTNWSVAAALPPKIQEVVKRKAAGLILITPPGVDDPRAAKLPATEESSRWMQPLDIPAIVMGADAGEALVAWADPSTSLMKLRREADEHGGVVPLGTKKAELQVTLDHSPRNTWNIAGILPGRGPLASQYIIIGAHYDHVGYGYTGGSRSDEYGIVHPGADDNASGASGLLLAAERLKAQYANLPKEASARSIMFVAFSAEEMGLIGSREFMKACPVEAKSIDCMLNMDMIGRLRDSHLEVSGTGTAEGFADILRPLFDASGLSVQQSPGGRGPSDHATFYGAGIPVLHFYTGMHEQYHTPRDTVDLINVPGAVQVVHLVCDIAETLARRPDQLVFKSTDKKGEKPDQSPGPTLGGLKVRFGIAPANYADGEAGVLVGEVYPGTCAAEAGIQPGDRLIRWNGKDIGDVANWMTYLAEHKPGDTVDVDVKRPPTGEEIRVRVTLKSRDQAPK